MNLVFPNSIALRLAISLLQLHVLWLISSLAFAQLIPPINSVVTRPIVVLPSIGTVVPPIPLPDPAVPSAITTPAADQNFRIWIFDPQNRNVALGSPGIFISVGTGPFTFVAASANGSLTRKLDPGAYTFDVVEPSRLSSTLERKRYFANVSSAGLVTIDGKSSTDARGFFAVTVTIKSVQTPIAQSRLAALTALANEPVSTFIPKSACQLVDQVTPNRSLSTDLSAGFPRVRTRLPAHGRIRALIVPIDFPDQQGVDNPATFFTPVANGTRDFYYAASYGRLAFDFAVLPNWVRMPFLITKYNLGTGGGTPDHRGYLSEIVNLTDSLIDYSEYDAVYFLLPKETPFSVVSIGPAITFPVSTRNGYITNGATGGGDMYLPQNGPNAMRNWVSHETGHAFGLYDEDLDHASATLGNWGIMANNWSQRAIEHIGWDRYLMGWLDETQVTCMPKHTLTVGGTTVKLDPLVRQNANNKVTMVPLTPSKMLVMESRKSEGLDVIPAGREGVLVYTVDMTIGQLGGGYRTQRRVGSTDVNFEDAALRTGDSITVDGVIITVQQIDSTGDTISVKAQTTAVNPVLSVARAGLGVGVVKSSPAGIDCTPTCFAGFAPGSSVTLTATPASGFSFTGWSGDCTGTGTCTVPMTSAKNVTASFYGQNVAATYNGLWWIETESGWGMSLTQRAGIMFMAWYTYDASGAPVWYVMSNCPIIGNGCTGDIFSVSGGVPLTAIWNNPTLGVTNVGRGTFLFSDVNTGTFTFTLNGVAGVKNITRQLFGSVTTAPTPDYTALYWAAPAGTQSGWGVAITQRFSVIFVTIFTYDANGKPIWYVASNCAVVGTSCTGALFQVNGGRVPTTAWGTPSLAVAQVGNITINFTDTASGTMNFTINGVAGFKAITKQIF